MSPENQNGQNGSISDRPSSDGAAEETVLAGAPDNAPYADESSAGKDLGNSAAISGYSDGGARGVSPNIGGFTSGTAKGSDVGASTNGNGGADANPVTAADPSRYVDQSTDNSNDPGGDVLEDDAMADQGGFKGA